MTTRKGRGEEGRGDRGEGRLGGGVGGGRTLTLPPGGHGQGYTRAHQSVYTLERAYSLTHSLLTLPQVFFDSHPVLRPQKNARTHRHLKKRVLHDASSISKECRKPVSGAQPNCFKA